VVGGKGCSLRNSGPNQTMGQPTHARTAAGRGSSEDALGASSNASSRMAGSTMHTVNETKQPEADLWTWIVIGLVFSAVTAALYGPFVWEHWVA
jgi:hypothetical protein